eukprot:3161414-Heterocapsa_arctica.AAC.1
MWHRRFGCPSSGQLRRANTSDHLRRAARLALQQGEAVGEAFARGLFSNPSHLFIPPKCQPEILWFNKPDDGRLTGTLFLDGSGKFNEFIGLRGAG